MKERMPFLVTVKLARRQLVDYVNNVFIKKICPLKVWLKCCENNELTALKTGRKSKLQLP